MFNGRPYLNKSKEEIVVKDILMSTFGHHTYLYVLIHLHIQLYTHINHMENKQMHTEIHYFLKITSSNTYSIIPAK